MRSGCRAKANAGLPPRSRSFREEVSKSRSGSSSFRRGDGVSLIKGSLSHQELHARKPWRSPRQRRRPGKGVLYREPDCGINTNLSGRKFSTRVRDLEPLGWSFFARKIASRILHSRVPDLEPLGWILLFLTRQKFAFLMHCATPTPLKPLWLSGDTG